MHDGSQSDGELVDRLQRRDEGALGELYDRYGRAVFSLALRMLGDPTQAEEVVHEVFLKLWRQPASYVPERGAFSIWLFSVTHHRVAPPVVHVWRS